MHADKFREPYWLETTDHELVVGYTSYDPIETTMNGITRVEVHSKYDLNEPRVKPIKN